MKMRFACGFCGVLLVCGLGTRAELIKDADARFGPGSLTLDTSTGLEWLNLTYSVGLSYDLAREATQSGGAFSGFRLAKADEVLTLYRSAGLLGQAWYPEGGPFDHAISSLLSLLGATGSQDGRPELFGISDTSTNPGSHLVPGLDVSFQEPKYGYVVSGGTFGTLAFGDATSDSAVGVWFVKPVPEPSVFALALVGAAFFRFRSSKLIALN